MLTRALTEDTFKNRSSMLKVTTGHLLWSCLLTVLLPSISSTVDTSVVRWSAQLIMKPKPDMATAAFVTNQNRIVSPLERPDTLMPIENQHWLQLKNMPIIESHRQICSNALVQFQDSLRPVHIQVENDTIFVNRYQVVDQIITHQIISVCKGNGRFISGRRRYISGTFSDTLSTMYGCDSIVVTELSVVQCGFAQLHVIPEICTDKNG